MPLNHYVTLGHSGLRVSPFCLGAMTFGEDLGWGSSVAESTRIMDRFIERGGNFIDTANAYTRGHSEKIIGDHLGRDPRKRERLVIATKFFSSLYVGDPNGGGANRKAIHAQLHESLRRLQTDYVDLYWMHAWDRFTPVEETMRALDDLVAAGKVRYIGFSDTPAWKAAQAQTIAQLRGWTPLAALQIEYSLLQRTVEGELVPMAQELGLGVTPWSPLKGGALSGKYRRADKGQHKPDRAGFVLGTLGEDRTYDVVEAVESIAKELGTTTARVALAWVQGRPGVASTIIGARTVGQLDDNLEALEVKLPPRAVAKLDEVSRPALNFPADFLNFIGSFGYGGTNIRGNEYPPFPNAPKNDSERY
ncbi:MAG: aldo/keto reductase [Polyangiaceae bacterium]|jgi:aryl-alcohol dehydrogenase-like predicted oxidoreductase